MCVNNNVIAVIIIGFNINANKYITNITFTRAIDANYKDLH